MGLMAGWRKLRPRSVKERGKPREWTTRGATPRHHDNPPVLRHQSSIQVISGEAAGFDAAASRSSIALFRNPQCLFPVGNSSEACWHPS